MSKINTTTQNIRMLRSEELDAVTGGIIDGCFPRLPFEQNLPRRPEPFIDQFAKKLPSWVIPL